MFLRSAPLPGRLPHGEDHGVGARQQPGEFGGGGALQVEQQRLGSGGGQVPGLFGAADEAGGAVAALGEQPFELERDLSVASGDDGTHGSDGSGDASRRPVESGRQDTMGA